MRNAECGVGTLSFRLRTLASRLFLTPDLEPWTLDFSDEPVPLPGYRFYKLRSFRVIS